MGNALREIMEGVLARLYSQVTTLVPPLLVALIVTLTAYLVAVVARWFLYRIFKGLTIDKFLRQSGLAFIIDPSGRLRATRVVAEGIYWAILLTGILTGLSAFDTELTTVMTQGFLQLVPKLAVAGLILLASVWFAHYLGRSVLVWAVNESLPAPRQIALVVKVLLVFVGVVAAADELNFARTVFLSAFFMVCGGLVLTLSLAIGLGAGRGLRRHLEKRQEQADPETSSLWNHL